MQVAIVSSWYTLGSQACGGPRYSNAQEPKNSLRFTGLHHHIITAVV